MCPSIDDYYSGGGSTLKPDDITEDEMTVVVKGWRSKTWDDGRKTVYLAMKDMDKELRVNVTNAGRIKEMYGREIEDWIGKPLTLFVDKVTSPKGGLVDSIVVRVKRTKRNSPPSKQGYDEQNPPPPLDDEIPF